MFATKKLVTVFSILTAGMIVAPVFALEVTEPAAASHGYPGLCDINGKKLADGEFRQWVENDRRAPGWGKLRTRLIEMQ